MPNKSSSACGSREVIQRLFCGSNDIVGLYENVWPDTLRNWVAEGYPVNDVGNPCDPLDVFGLDLGRIGGMFDTSPWPGTSRLIERTDEWEIVENSSGVTEKRWLSKSAPAGHLSFRLTGPQAWESEFKPVFVKTDSSRVPVASLRKAIKSQRAANRWVCFNMTFIWENFRQTVGDIRMYEGLLDDPEWIIDYNQTQLDFFIRHYEIALAEAGPLDGAWFSEDLAYNQGLFCSPNTLRELYLPFYSALVDYLHGKGMNVILHSCGNVTAALPLIVEAGFDALHPMQVRAGCDPLAISKAYAGRLVLLGGLDSHMLERGDAGEIRQAQVGLMQGMRDAGASYIFCSDHSISTNVRYDTYQRVIETYHKYAGR